SRTVSPPPTPRRTSTCAVFGALRHGTHLPVDTSRMMVPPYAECRVQYRPVASTCPCAERSVRALRLLDRLRKPHKLCSQIGARPWAHLARGANEPWKPPSCSLNSIPSHAC